MPTYSTLPGSNQQSLFQIVSLAALSVFTSDLRSLTLQGPRRLTLWESTPEKIFHYFFYVNELFLPKKWI